MTKGTPKIGPPKAKTSYRNIPVPEGLRDVAMAFRKTDHTYIWLVKKRSCVIPSPSAANLPLHWRRWATRVLSPHCCRHTYISPLQSMGVDIQTIQSLSGHADIDMTEHYLHVQDEVKVSAVAKSNHLKSLIKNAGYAIPSASVEDIEYLPERKLDKSQILRLASCAYIQEAHNVILLGATCAGKTYLACALGMAANRNLPTGKEEGFARAIPSSDPAQAM